MATMMRLVSAVGSWVARAIVASTLVCSSPGLAADAETPRPDEPAARLPDLSYQQALAVGSVERLNTIQGAYKSQIRADETVGALASHLAENFAHMKDQGVDVDLRTFKLDPTLAPGLQDEGKKLSGIAGLKAVALAYENEAKRLNKSLSNLNAAIAQLDLQPSLTSIVQPVTAAQLKGKTDEALQRMLDNAVKGVETSTKLAALFADRANNAPDRDVNYDVQPFKGNLALIMSYANILGLDINHIKIHQYHKCMADYWNEMASDYALNAITIANAIAGL